MLVMTWKVSPSLKIIPKLIKMLNFSNLCIPISKFRNRLFLRPDRVPSKNRVPKIIEIFIGYFWLFWNRVIKRKRGVKSFFLFRICKDFIRLLNLQPHMVVKFLGCFRAFKDFLLFCHRSLLIRMVLKSEFSIRCFDLSVCGNDLVVLKA